MRILNSENHYGVIAICLHWLMAILIIGLLILGLYMTRVPVSLWKLKLYGWHKELGVLVLGLFFVRLFWRVVNFTPSLTEYLAYWEIFAARAVHWAFYGFMFLLPISGWMISSAAGLSVSFFGLFIMPDFVSANEHLRLLAEQVHEWLAYGLIAAICMHSAAAFKHHFINKDDILRRMFS